MFLLGRRIRRPRPVGDAVACPRRRGSSTDDGRPSTCGSRPSRANGRLSPSPRVRPSSTDPWRRRGPHPSGTPSRDVVSALRSKGLCTKNLREGSLTPKPRCPTTTAGGGERNRRRRRLPQIILGAKPSRKATVALIPTNSGALQHRGRINHLRAAVAYCRNAVLCVGRAQPVVHVRLRNRLPFRLRLWISAGSLAVRGC